jgi:FdhE protein
MNRWDRRIERAQVLEAEYPAAAQLLRLYCEIARFQSTIVEQPFPAFGSATDSTQIRDALRPHIYSLLKVLQRAAPPELAQAAALLALIDDWDPADPTAQFVTRVLTQPYAERDASRAKPASSGESPTCPFCQELPVAAVLRPEGDGGKRSLICSVCSTEWNFRRLLCPKCGEEDQQKLPVFTADQFPHIRVEACDTCRTYLKSIDMTRNGLAVPEVDELASLPLDLWASGNNYTKLQPNMFGL